MIECIPDLPENVLGFTAKGEGRWLAWRNPGQGMNRFDEATIPEKDAMSIAEYVLNTFR